MHILVFHYQFLSLEKFHNSCKTKMGDKNNETKPYKNDQESFSWLILVCKAKRGRITNHVTIFADMTRPSGPQQITNC